MKPRKGIDYEAEEGKTELEKDEDTEKEALGNEDKKIEDEKKSESKLGIVLRDILKYILITIGIIAPLLLAIGYFTDNSLLTGLGIILLGLIIYVFLKGFRMVPHKTEEIVEVFGGYDRKLTSGANIIIPGAETVRSSITVNATKLIKLFMTKDDKLEFADDSAEMQVDIKVRTKGSYGPTYSVMFTREELEAIEEREEDKDHDLLPEPWMYYAMAQVESALRGVCGNLSIDDAIKAVSYIPKNLRLGRAKYEMDTEIPVQAKEIANRELRKYNIELQEILIKNITLNEETDKARRAIQLQNKAVEKEKGILKQKEIQADEGTQEGLREKNRLDAIREGDPKLSRGDVMRYEVAKEAAGNIGNVVVISGGEGGNVPYDVATRLGASFGVGQKAVSETALGGKKKKEDKDKEKEEKGGGKKKEESEIKKEQRKKRAEEKTKEGEEE